MTKPTTPAISDGEKLLDRPVVLCAARAWWQAHMSSNIVGIDIKGDGRVNVHWRDADEDGKYTLPVDFLRVSPSIPPALVEEAIRQGKIIARDRYGVEWRNLEEISRFEIVFAAINALPQMLDAVDQEK